ncbi:MAG: ParB/RepB/Spo0J family partition protein [Pyrinomonadaceae bacterium]
MSKRGLPASVQMRHDSHYVDEIATSTRTIGKTIQIHLIAPNPEQPRREIGDLTELSNSIKEKGVLEPLLVKPDRKSGTYMIIAGERRWRASQLAGLTEVPCIELDLDEKGVAEIALIENLQRKDLTIWEEADGLAALREKFGYTQDEIAQKISKGRSVVNELMTIASLPSEIRLKCRQAKIISKTTLLEIARQFDEHAMFETVDRIATGKPGRPKLAKIAHREIGSPTAGNGARADAKPGIFSYTSPDSLFNIEIRFNKVSERSRRSVLRALKQAFEDVKKGSVDV